MQYRAARENIKEICLTLRLERLIITEIYFNEHVNVVLIHFFECRNTFTSYSSLLAAQVSYPKTYGAYPQECKTIYVVNNATHLSLFKISVPKLWIY